MCTGYDYHLDFINAPGLNSHGKKVTPLYHHLFFAKDPSLTFVGLPYKIVPFPLMEHQARWIAHYLSGRPNA